MDKIKVSDVKVGSRFRKDLGDISELKTSIKTVGIIEPIIVDENKSLIAGERRLKSCIELGMDTIPVKYAEGLTDTQKKEIELEENIRRKSFTWVEQVMAQEEVHRLKQEANSNWGFRDTASILDKSLGSVSMDLQLAKALKVFPELAKEKSKTIAFNKLKEKQERILSDEVARRLQNAGLQFHLDIINGDCVTEMGKMPSETFDLIIADPPYGISLEGSEMSKSHSQIYQFEDDEYKVMNMLDKAFEQMFRVLRNDRHAYIFFAISNYAKVRDLLIKHKFMVHRVPLIWDKGSGGFPSQHVSFTASYEPFFFCCKGSRKLKGSPRDVFPIKRVPPNQKIHPTEKPTELLRNLINISTIPGESVLDPFAGSGSTIVAAKETGRQGTGIELDKTYCGRISTLLEKGGSI